MKEIISQICFKISREKGDGEICECRDETRLVLNLIIPESVLWTDVWEFVVLFSLLF